MGFNMQEHLENKEKMENLIKTIFILCVIVFSIALGSYFTENKTAASYLFILAFIILTAEAILIMMLGLNNLNAELQKEALADK